MSEVRVVRDANWRLSVDQMLTRGLLVGGFLTFVAGALGLVLSNWVSMPYEDGLRWLAAHSTSWTISTVLLAVSLVLCSAGLAAFNEYFPLGGARLLAKAGFITFFVGSLSWVLAMGYRLSVDPWAAQILVESSQLPDALTPLRALDSVLHDIFMFSTLLGSAIYGLALIRSPLFSSALGWFALGYGLVVAVSEALTSGPIPGMALIVPLILGMSPLPDLPENGRRHETPVSLPGGPHPSTGDPKGGKEHERKRR